MPLFSNQLSEYRQKMTEKRHRLARTTADEEETKNKANNDGLFATSLRADLRREWGQGIHKAPPPGSWFKSSTDEEILSAIRPNNINNNNSNAPQGGHIMITSVQPPLTAVASATASVDDGISSTTSTTTTTTTITEQQQQQDHKTEDGATEQNGGIITEQLTFVTFVAASNDNNIVENKKEETEQLEQHPEEGTNNKDESNNDRAEREKEARRLMIETLREQASLFNVNGKRKRNTAWAAFTPYVDSKFAARISNQSPLTPSRIVSTARQPIFCFVSSSPTSRSSPSFCPTDRLAVAADNCGDLNGNGNNLTLLKIRMVDGTVFHAQFSSSDTVRHVCEYVVQMAHNSNISIEQQTNDNNMNVVMCDGEQHQQQQHVVSSADWFMEERQKVENWRREHVHRSMTEITTRAQSNKQLEDNGVKFFNSVNRPWNNTQPQQTMVKSMGTSVYANGIRICSGYPRRRFSRLDDWDLTLKDAEMCPSAGVFVEKDENGFVLNYTPQYAYKGRFIMA